MSEYAWFVSHGAIVEDSSGSGGQIGPRGAKNLARFDIVINNGRQFRMLDENGESRYPGRIQGTYSGREPLEEYGREKGCVCIELGHDSESMKIKLKYLASVRP